MFQMWVLSVFLCPGGSLHCRDCMLFNPESSSTIALQKAYRMFSKPLTVLTFYLQHLRKQICKFQGLSICLRGYDGAGLHAISHFVRPMNCIIKDWLCCVRLPLSLVHLPQLLLFLHKVLCCCDVCVLILYFPVSISLVYTLTAFHKVMLNGLCRVYH